MQRHDEEITWSTDGKPVRIGMTRFGAGPPLLLLPALSSISTRDEMWPLQQRLGARYTTLAIDWPGFGTLPRPKVAWQPDHYRAFLRFVIDKVIQPSVTIAAGHGAGYALGVAAETGRLGKLMLLSPTWRGPLPTMMKKPPSTFAALAKAVDLPVAGNAFYRLNVNGPVIGMMARAHVYADREWLNAERMTGKRRVTEAEGARYASFRFVAGALDPFTGRASVLDAARRAGDILLVFGKNVPPKSKAEMRALAELSNVTAIELPRGKLSFYEEFPDDAAEAIESGSTPA